MISMLALTLALARGQDTNHVPIPVQVSYRIKFYDHSGLISAPRVLTLDGEKAAIMQKTDDREFNVVVLPHASSDGNHLTTELELSLTGAPSVTTTLREPSGVASYIKISKKRSRDGNTTAAVAISTSKPRLSREDYLAVVNGRIQQPPENNPFTIPREAPQLGAAPPTQIQCQVVISDRKGVVASPVVRTVNNEPARVDIAERVSMGLRPRTMPNGELFTFVEFKLDGDEVALIAIHGKPGHKQLFKIWKEDAATAHVEPLASPRQAHLKSGEWLVQVTGTVVNDQP
jgi:hypothetical protein